MKKFTTIILITLITVFNLSNKCFAQYVKLLDLSGASSGRAPWGSLISDGTFLYGMTSNGGTNDSGTVFKIKPNGTGYSKLIDFAGTTNGAFAQGSLISDGTFLYGLTQYGGSSDLGVVFKIKPDGTGYSKMIDFAGTINGSRPCGSLIYDGTFLYGMTTLGGAYNAGNIFKIKPDGTLYSVLYNFGGIVNDGFRPNGSLISDGTFLYGMTKDGGASSMGTIFKIKPDGTDYVKFFDFAGFTNGQNPLGSLIFEGPFLYGMTKSGGSNYFGTIFKIKPDGTSFSKLLDFNGVPNGENPLGSLIFEGTFLYGMTQGGGSSSDAGVIFRIKVDGTGYSKLFSFTNNSSASGMHPPGSLFSDGTSLYGMTYDGGTGTCSGFFGGCGTIFKYGLGTTTIDENNEPIGFNIYPNPFTSQTTITFTQEQKNTVIKIIDVLGKEIKNLIFTGKLLLIDKEDIKDGIYFVQIIDENNNVANRKIIIY